MRMNHLLIMYMVIFIAIKFLFVFVKKYLRTFSKLFFIIDLTALFFLVIGSYIYFEEIHKIYYLAYGFYILIHVFCFLANSIAFTILTIANLKNDYNFVIGIPLMLATTITTLRLCDMFMIEHDLTLAQYFYVFFI